MGTIWTARTDGKSICTDCAFRDVYNKSCTWQIDIRTTLQPSTCEHYVSTKTVLKKEGEENEDNPHT